jgi:hypothetical protein
VTVSRKLPVWSLRDSWPKYTTPTLPSMMRSATAIASTSRDSRFAKTNPNGFISDYDAAGIGIDLDLGDLAAVGEVFRNAAPNLHSRRQPKNQTSPSITVACRQHAPSQPGRLMTAAKRY